MKLFKGILFISLTCIFVAPHPMAVGAAHAELQTTRDELIAQLQRKLFLMNHRLQTLIGFAHSMSDENAYKNQLMLHANQAPRSQTPITPERLAKLAQQEVAFRDIEATFKETKKTIPIFKDLALLQQQYTRTESVAHQITSPLYPNFLSLRIDGFNQAYKDFMQQASEMYAKYLHPNFMPNLAAVIPVENHQPDFSESAYFRRQEKLAAGSTQTYAIAHDHHLNNITDKNQARFDTEKKKQAEFQTANQDSIITLNKAFEDLKYNASLLHDTLLKYNALEDDDKETIAIKEDAANLAFKIQLLIEKADRAIARSTRIQSHDELRDEQLRVNECMQQINGYYEEARNYGLISDKEA